MNHRSEELTTSLGRPEVGAWRPRRLALTLLPFLFLLLIGLIRDTQGGDTATITPMIALTVVWFALYGNRVELAAGILGAGAVIALPVILVGGPAYPDSELSLAGTYVIVLAIAGIATSTLVRQREELLAEVSLLARTDSLTGLANRRAWDEMLRRELARSAREGAAVSVAIVDLDHFKNYNDRHGHTAGDHLLREAAADWSKEIRVMDGLARYGGEEFAFLLPAAELGDAAAVIERIRAATPAGISASAGVAQWDGVEERHALVARADRALYEAKRAGRDRVHLAPTPGPLAVVRGSEPPAS